MKASFAWAIALMLAVGCGGKKGGSTTSPGGAAAADACKQAGGSCMAQAAEGACASQPANACPEGQICCVPATAGGGGGW
jgi:hypothetical protein